jgi:hypothetical protein
MIPGNAPALLIRERMAATNKFLAQNNKSDAGGKATNTNPLSG